MIELWIPVTITAAFMQNLRSAVQKHLKGRLSTTGATFVRFGFGVPIAVAYVLFLHFGIGLPIPQMNGEFVAYTVLGGITQILATFLLVYLFIHFTDPITDRTEAPFGFIYYRASLKTVFYANWTPFLKVLKPWGNFPPEQMEGLGYVGVPGILALPGLLLLGLLQGI